MGFPNCSTKLVSSLIFSAQIVGAFTATEGDCQYVLLRMTVPPQLLIVSVKGKCWTSLPIVIKDLWFALLTQQMFPRKQNPLGRPPNSEQTEPEAQIPVSPFLVVHASNGRPKLGINGTRLARLKRGLSLFTVLSWLLKIPLPKMKRLSAWFFSPSLSTFSN